MNHPSDSESMRVLIVEDDEITREILEGAVQDAGYQTRAADDGQNGLLAFEEFAPDLILTDIEMPRMNGLEFLSRVREQNSRVIVVMITASGNEEYVFNALRLRANDYLRKPININDLLAILSKYALSIEEERIDSELMGMVLRSSIKMRIDNRVDLVYRVVDFLLAQSGAAIAEGDRLGIRLGLVELIINSIEHGNLEITYAEKSAALDEGAGTEQLLRARLAQPRLAARRVTIDYLLDDTVCEWVISDEGRGFDWKAMPSSFEEVRLENLHGRGILLSRLQFDELQYLGNGNAVRARKFVQSAANSAQSTLKKIENRIVA